MKFWRNGPQSMRWVGVNSIGELAGLGVVFGSGFQKGPGEAAFSGSLIQTDVLGRGQRLAGANLTRRTVMMNKPLLIGLSLIAVAGQSYAADSGANGKMAAAGELEWVETSPGSPLKRAILWGDRNSGGEYAMLLRMPAGFVAPIHAHTGDYHGMNLTGTWRHSFDGGEQRDLPPGSYVFQPGMGMHGDSCVGPEDCILFIHQHAKGDFIPKQ